jgi:hypothetical protein
MTHNHNTWAKALVSGGCVISGEINFDYRTFFSKQWCIIPRGFFILKGFMVLTRKDQQCTSLD